MSSELEFIAATQQQLCWIRDRRSWRGHVYVDIETRWFGGTDRLLHSSRSWQDGVRFETSQRSWFKGGGRLFLRGMSFVPVLAVGRCFRLVLGCRIVGPQPVGWFASDSSIRRAAPGVTTRPLDAGARWHLDKLMSVNLALFRATSGFVYIEMTLRGCSVRTRVPVDIFSMKMWRFCQCMIPISELIRSV